MNQDTSVPIQAAASLLFVPGNSRKMLEKSLKTSAGLICSDLEDAVAPDAKAEARQTVLEWLNETGEGARTGVRINALMTSAGLEDLIALARCRVCPAFVLLAKSEHVSLLQLADAVMVEHDRRVPLLCLIETVAGAEAAHQLARAPACAGIMFGAFDYAADAGCSLDDDVLFPIRCRVASAANAAEKPAWDSPFGDVDDVPRAEDAAHLAQRIGFTGKAAIHPRFLDGIHTAFRPTPTDVEQAKQIITAFEDSGSSVIAFEGKMVDLPVVRRMRRILAQAEASNS